MSGQSEQQKTSPGIATLDVRLGNWGRWSRRLEAKANRRFYNHAPPNDADAILIERAVSRLDGTVHAQLLRAWHQGLAHQSRIAHVLRIPRRSLGACYRDARKALGKVLSAGDSASWRGGGGLKVEPDLPRDRRPNFTCSGASFGKGGMEMLNEMEV